MEPGRKTRCYGELRARARARACSLGPHWPQGLRLDYSKGVVKLHWGSCGATMGLRWHTQSGRKALYTTVSRARECRLEPHWGYGGSTLGLWWRYDGAATTHGARSENTKTTVSRARARMRLEATLELWWGYTGTVVGLHLGFGGATMGQ